MLQRAHARCWLLSRAAEPCRPCRPAVGALPKDSVTVVRAGLTIPGGEPTTATEYKAGSTMTT